MLIRAPIFVSVIIPVFAGCQKLWHCLDALQKQSYSHKYFEVIVVDNGQNEGIENIVKQYPQALLAKETIPGSYAARNRGIACAKGNVIAFTDSDCIPESGWVEHGVARISEVVNCGLVAGRIEYCFKKDNTPNFIELCDTILFPMEQDFNIEQRKCAGGANLFTSMEVIRKVGTFNAVLKAGGDDEWAYRVFLHGYAQAYAPEACVKHLARGSLKSLILRGMRFAGAEYASIRLLNNHPVQIFLETNIFSLGFRIRWFTQNIIKGVFDNKNVRFPVIFLIPVIFVQTVVAFFKTVEYIKIMFGSEARR